MADEFMKIADCLLNVDQVAKLIHMKKSTIYFWVHKGYIPHVKFPGAVRFQAYEVLEWIKKNKRGGKPVKSPSEVANQFLNYKKYKR